MKTSRAEDKQMPAEHAPVCKRPRRRFLLLPQPLLASVTTRTSGNMPRVPHTGLQNHHVSSCYQSVSRQIEQLASFDVGVKHTGYYAGNIARDLQHDVSRKINHSKANKAQICPDAAVCEELMGRKGMAVLECLPATSARNLQSNEPRWL